MKESTVYDVLTQIYSWHSKAPNISRTSAIVSKIAEKCEDIPDYAASYIEDAIGSQKTLPSNMVQAFRDAWDSYCQAHPSAKAAGSKCQYCYGNGGWNYFKVVGGKTGQFWSFCPHCTPQNEATRKTPRQLQEEGALVVPSTYPGGLAKFRIDYGIDPMPPQNSHARQTIEKLRAMMAQRIQPGYAEA